MVGKLEMLKVRNKTQEGRFRVRNISKLFSTIISKALSTSISKKYPCIWHLMFLTVRQKPILKQEEARCLLHSGSSACPALTARACSPVCARNSAPDAGDRVLWSELCSPE